MRSQSAAFNGTHTFAAALADRPAIEYAHCPSCGAPYRPTTYDGRLVDWCLRCGDVGHLLGVAAERRPPDSKPRPRRASPAPDTRTYRTSTLCVCGRRKAICVRGRAPAMCDKCDPAGARRREQGRRLAGERRRQRGMGA